MTEDRLPEATPLDELASALLDGEATAAEEARRAEPAVQQRLEAFGAVARLVGEAPEPPADADRERVLTAALAAFDVLAGDAGGAAVDGGAGDGDELASRRARRRGPRWLPAVAAAAVVALGLGGVLAVVGGDDRGREVATAVQEDAAEAGSAESATALESDAAAEEAGTGGGPGAGDGAAVPAGRAAGELGAFDSLDALVDAVETGDLDALLDAPPFTEAPYAEPVGGGGDAGPAATSDEGGAPPCPAPDGSLVYTATLAGRPVLVWVDPATITVVDPATCAPVEPPRAR